MVRELYRNLSWFFAPDILAMISEKGGMSRVKSMADDGTAARAD